MLNKLDSFPDKQTSAYVKSQFIANRFYSRIDIYIGWYIQRTNDQRIVCCCE